MEKRYVYGTKSKKWHLVGSEDRDFKCGITKTEMQRVGKTAAKKKYLAPNRVCKIKKKTIFVLQGTYGHGWEDLTAEETRAEIRQRLKEYRENEGGNYRIITRRE